MRRRRFSPLTIVVFLSLLVSFGIARLYIPYATPLWDEAVFLGSAYKIYHSITASDPAAFWAATLEQFSYPPLQSWILGLGTALTGGFSVERARYVGLIWFFLNAVTIFLLARSVSGSIGRTEKENDAAGLMASLLFLSSPLMIHHGAITIKESMGASLATLTALFYVKFRGDNRIASGLLVSLLVFLVIMTKYHHGIFVIAAIGTAGLWEILFSSKRLQAVRSLLLILVPAGLLFSGWLLYPTNQLARFLTILQNNPLNYTAGIGTVWDYTLFYVRSVLFMYSPSLAIGVFILFGLFLAIRFFGNTNIRFLWLGFAFALIVLTTHPTNVQDRYISTVMPYLLVISSVTWTSVIAGVAKARRLPLRLMNIAIAIFVALISLPEFLGIPNRVYAVGSISIKGNVYAQKDYNDMWFNYDTRTWPRQWAWDVKERPSDIIAFIVENTDITKPVRLVGRANEISPPYVDLAITLARKKAVPRSLPYRAYHVTLEIFPDSMYYTRDYRIINEWLMADVHDALSNPAYTKLAEKTFMDMGVRARIFGE